MPTYRHSSGKRFLFIHIPRTGGRFFEENLKLNGFKAEQELWKSIDGVEVAHFHKDLYEKYLDVKDIPHIAIVRDPTERFISCSIFLKKMFGDIDDQLEDELYFSSMIENYPLSEGRNWFRPQVDFLSDNTSIWNFSNGLGDEFGKWVETILDVPFKIYDVPYCQISSDKIPRVKKTEKLLRNISYMYQKDYLKLNVTNTSLS